MAIADVPQEALELHESAEIVEASDDGSFLMYLIRPCVGRGKGRHIYEADMLAREASKPAGWKMFLNHETAAQKRARGSLPRPVEQLGGRIVESWWDPSVPAEGRFGQGAVVGRVRPTPFVRALVKNDPGLLDCSINTRATSVSPRMVDGQQAWLVEGLQPRGTVDFVTEGGAGGRVAELAEAVYADEEVAEMALMESMTDAELLETIQNERPALAALIEARANGENDDDAEDAADGGADEAAEGEGSGEEDDAAARYRKKGLPPALAARAAKRAKAARESAREDDEMALKPGALREALDTDEGREFIAAVRDAVVGEIAPMIVEAVDAAVEKTAGVREAAEDEGTSARRLLELRDLRDAAHRQIDAANLPPRWRERLKAEYALVEGAPTEALLVEAVEVEDGEVEETAESVLEKRVAAQIQEARDLIRESAPPTRVRGQGPARTAGDEGDGKGEQPQGAARYGDLVEAEMASAGFDPADDPWKGL